MLLSDGTIASRLFDPDRWEPWQRLVVDPLPPGAIQPCSIDVFLGDGFKVYDGARMDTRRDNAPWWHDLPTEPSDRGGSPCWVLQPDRFYLGVLRQFIRVPEDCCGFLHGVSTRARDGLTPHQQSGLLDPGWEGWATLEITVCQPHTILYPGMRIGQVTFMPLDARCVAAYHGRYQGDSAAQPARIGLGGAS